MDRSRQPTSLQVLTLKLACKPALAPKLTSSMPLPSLTQKLSPAQKLKLTPAQKLKLTRVLTQTRKVLRLHQLFGLAPTSL